jgi:carbon storage regulator CsrA
MLTLTRRIGERIAIGGAIEIEVLAISGGRVRLGIVAPRALPVHRTEVLQRIEVENRRAVASDAEIRAAAETCAITFPEGLPGMRDQRRFVLCELAEGGPVRALVSCDTPSIRLLVAEALDVCPDYPVANAIQAAALDDEEVSVALVITATADGSEATANLMAPLVIGLARRQGQQVILEGSGLGVRHPLLPKAALEPAAPDCEP